MPRIALVGPGAVGSALAAWLHDTSRHELTVCARRPFSRIDVQTPTKRICFEPPVLTEPEAAAPVDWALVTTKAYDSAGAAAWLKRLCGAGAPAVILQNGVEHVERFAPFLPAGQILPAMIDLPAERAADLRVTQRGPGKIVVPDGEAGRAFVRLFEGTPLSVTTTADFKSAIWRKLCLNSAGVISALLLKPTGVLRDEPLGDIARTLVAECVAVGRAEGAVLEDELPEAVLAGYRAAPPDGVNSLHADRAAGRPTEIDARNGVIVRLGRKHGIPTPCNAMAVALLSEMSRG